MEAPAHGITAPPGIYEIDGRRFEIGSRDFAEAIADAYAAHQRPRCMCLAEGVEMYVARLREGYIVKRMPETGNRHAPDCPSYAPPADLSGLAQVLGSAIREDPATGETILKLDFPLAQTLGRSQIPEANGDSGGAASDGAKLSLRGLLHYLWDQAGLTRWHPGFTGKRTWATVRNHLLDAAERKLVGGNAVRNRLYVPEPFLVDERDIIHARRLAHWQSALACAPRMPRPLMLLIGELKEIVPARYGFRAIIKHLPDQAFIVDESLYRRLERRFESELALWSTSDDIHMVMMATFGVNIAGVPALHRLCVMPTNRQWLPVDHGFGKMLIDKLVAEGRSFIKGLHYNLGGGPCAQTAEAAFSVLTDCGPAPARLVVLTGPLDGLPRSALDQEFDGSTWIWRCSLEPMPELPSRAHNDRWLHVDRARARTPG